MSLKRLFVSPRRFYFRPSRTIRIKSPLMYLQFPIFLIILYPLIPELSPECLHRSIVNITFLMHPINVARLSATSYGDTNPCRFLCVFHQVRLLYKIKCVLWKLRFIAERSFWPQSGGLGEFSLPLEHYHFNS